MKPRYLFGLPFVTGKINTREIELLIDTGFNGSVLLPIETIHDMNLSPVAVGEYALADGTITETNIFEGTIDWFGKKKRISIISSPSDFCLLGMELLYELRTVIEPAKGILHVKLP